MPSKPRFSCRARTDSGFGVVEVVIAVLLIMVVTSGLVLAISSSTSLRGATRMQSSLTRSGQAMIEKLAHDNGWMKSCTLDTSPCNIAPVITGDADLLKLADVDGTAKVVETASATNPQQYTHATAVDSEADGKGDQDADGVIPDFYQVMVVIQPDDATAARYGVTAEKLRRSFSTSLDQNGNTLKGSLSIDACVALDQVDERISINGCREDGVTRLMMPGCPSKPPTLSAFERCPEAWEWASTAAQTDSPTKPSTYVSLKRIPTSSLNLTIQNMSGGGSPISSSQAKIVNGSFVFENIEAGTYAISGIPSSIGVGGVNYPRWVTKDLPADHSSSNGSVGVQPGIKNHALVMYRPPKPSDGGIKFYFDREVKHYTLNNFTSGPEKSTGPVANSGELWVPTDKYQGDKAEEYCKSMMAMGIAFGSIDGHSPTSVKSGVVGSTFKITMLYRSSTYPGLSSYTDMIYFCNVPFGVAAGGMKNCVTATFGSKSYSYPDHHFKASQRKAGYGGSEFSATACTFYRNELTHSAWKPGPADVKVYPGAVKSAAYAVSPRPTTREINFDPSGVLANMTVPQSLCKVTGHVAHDLSKDRSTCTADSTMDKLFPGLNTGITEPFDIELSGGEENATNAKLNRNITGYSFPSWSVGGGLWVRPDGSILGASKTVVSNPTVHLRGDGECYWRGGPYLPSPYEGLCDPYSNITWKPGPNGSYKNTRAILSKTCVSRYVLETVEGGGALTDPTTITGPFAVPGIGGGGDSCIGYTPEWICTTSPPTIYDGNCRPPKPKPPAILQVGVYKVKAGTATVNQKPVNVNPGASLS